MFQLVTISDLVEILPRDFEKPSRQALEDNINRKYADKVIQQVGLCLGLHDLLSSSDGLIGHGTGIVNVNVIFRLVVFRPFKGEIMEVIIMKSDESGIRCALNSLSDGSMGVSITHLDFFDEIWIPKANLFSPSEYHEDEKVWQWNQEGGEFYFDMGERARIRVEEEEWVDQSPEKPSSDPHARPKEKTSPYRIIGSMSLPGLGPNQWWDDAEEETLDTTQGG